MVIEGDQRRFEGRDQVEGGRKKKKDEGGLKMKRGNLKVEGEKELRGIPDASERYPDLSLSLYIYMSCLYYND